MALTIADILKPGRNGIDLREKFVLALIDRVLKPREYGITTMSDNNWIERKFQTHELFALLTASPEDREHAYAEASK